MKLAIPIFDGGKIYNEVEIKKPKTGVIASVYEIADRGNVFRAMVEFVARCIESITSMDGDIIEEPNAIKRLCGSMPYLSAEAIALRVMALINEDDTVEGVYKCPRCGNKVMTEYDEILDIDTRDRISELEIVCLEEADYNNRIPVELEESVKITNSNTKEVLEEINSFEIRYPTMKDCIISANNMIEGQEVRVQIKIYINSLITVNGNPVDKKWISTWGAVLFRNTSPVDLAQIGNKLRSYGLKKTAERTCNKCGKVWNAPINTSNFFVSGLQPT